MRKFSRQNSIQPDEQVVTIRVAKPNQPEEILAYEHTVVAPVGATDTEFFAYLQSVHPDWTFKSVAKRHVAGRMPTSYATQEVWGY